MPVQLKSVGDLLDVRSRNEIEQNLVDQPKTDQNRQSTAGYHGRWSEPPLNRLRKCAAAIRTDTSVHGANLSISGGFLDGFVVHHSMTAPRRGGGFMLWKSSRCSSRASSATSCGWRVGRVLTKLAASVERPA